MSSLLNYTRRFIEEVRMVSNLHPFSLMQSSEIFIPLSLSLSFCIFDRFSKKKSQIMYLICDWDKGGREDN